MDRRRFWKLLPFVAFAPAAIAAIKPDPGPKHFTGGLVKFIAENDYSNVDWAAGMSEQELDKWTNQAFKYREISADWCRQRGKLYIFR